MSWRFWFGLLPCALFVGLLAVSNRQSLTLTLDPFPIEIVAPVYLQLLGATFVGFVVGAISLWFAQGGTRRRQRDLKREAQALRTELAARPAERTADDAAAPPALAQLPHA